MEKDLGDRFQATDYSHRVYMCVRACLLRFASKGCVCVYIYVLCVVLVRAFTMRRVSPIK